MTRTVLFDDSHAPGEPPPKVPRRRTPEYNIWAHIIGRCTCPTNRAYKWYGARGIGVCDHWRKFENFLADMGKRPSRHHQIDRINNNDGYYPGNCRWVTSKENNNNRRGNVLIEWRGEQHTASQWSISTGIPANVIRSRVRLGWAAEDALTLPMGEARKIRALCGEKNPGSRLTDAQVREIRGRLLAGEKIIPLGKEYGVHFAVISNIKTGKRRTSDESRQAA